MQLITVTAVASASFAATSLDNLLILIGLMGRDYPRRSVVRGYLSGMLLVAALSAGASIAAHQLPARYLGYLGLIPIGLGAWHLLQLRSRTRGVPDGAPGGGSALEVAMVTVGASGDSLATFVALLSDSEASFAVPILATLAVCSVGWLGLARYLASHDRVASLLRRAGPYLMPLLLVAIGTYILLDSPTDVVG